MGNKKNTRLVRGDQLTDAQRKQAEAQFIYRGTIENQLRNPGPVARARGTAPLVTDAEWFAAHAFYINREGELSRRESKCEPAYMAS